MRKFLPILTLFASLLFAQVIFAQSGIKGVVVDSQTGETLIGASVVLDGTSVGAATTLNGSFSFTAPTGAQTIAISYIGYIQKTMNVTVGSDMKDLGEISLEPNAVGLQEVEVISSIAINRKTPVAVSTINAQTIETKLGSQEFPEILKTTPSVYTTKSGGGFGDARVNIRGFNQRNVAVMINGIPVNDMENGWVYWSNWAGLGDATRTVQVQRGLGASKLAISSVGGTMNIITKTTDMEKGGSLSFSATDYGRMKTMLTLSSGLMDNNWAVTFVGSRTQGNGYMDETWVDAWSYFLSVTKKINDQHTLVFTGIGAPQKHGQNYDQISVATREKYGKKYNPNWGYKYGTTQNERINYYHKPQFSLNWYYNISDRTELATSAYFSTGRGGGSGPLGSYWTKRTADGQIDYTDAYENNVNQMDTLFQTAKNDPVISSGDNVLNSAGDTIVGGYSQSILRNSVNSHNWFGLMSTLNHELSDYFTLVAGIDGRSYKGIHYREVRDLLGGDFFFEEYKYAADGIGGRNQMMQVDDKIAYDNDGLVTYGGLFAQLEYSNEALSAFVSGNISNTWYKRVDRYNYLGENAMKSDGTPGTSQVSEVISKFAYSAKAGANYNINEHHNVFVNGGYFERAPFFDKIFVNYSNDVSSNIENEKVTALEVGYGYTGSTLNAKVNAYYTDWKDKSLLSRGFKDPATGADTRSMIEGLSALHQGIEAEITIQVAKPLSLGVVAAFGDWKWTNNVNAVVVNDETLDTLAVVDVYADGLMVADAPQTQFGLLLDWNITKNFKFSAEYMYYAQLFAEFDPADRNDPDDLVQPYEIPGYDILDLHLGYKFKIGSIKAYAGMNVFNVLNTDYMAEALDGSDHTVNSVEAWWGYQRNFNFTTKIYF